MKAMGDFGVLAESTTSKPGVYREMAERFNKAALSDADWAGFESHVRRAWPTGMGNDANIILKGSSKLGGEHARDLWHSPVYTTLKKAINDMDPRLGLGFKTDGDLRTHLMNYVNETAIEPSLGASAKHMLKNKGRGGDLRRKHFNIISEEKMTPEMKAAGGVWIQDGFPGTSITEGGVNGVYKVDKNFKVTQVLSDEHNYFENVTKPLLPNNQMMVSMPIQKDMLMERWLTEAQKKKGGAEGKNFGYPNPEEVNLEAAIKTIRGIKNAKPTTLGTLEETIGIANRARGKNEEE